MLLPSALPCDARPRAHHLFTPLPPSDSSALTTGIYTTCRALQSLLAATSSPTPPLSPPQRAYKRPLQSPIAIIDRTSTTHNAPGPHRATHTSPPRGPNKRRRSSDRNSAPCDQEPYTTPKRPRLLPPSLPLGLSPSDFESLSPQPPYSTHTPSSSTTTPTSNWTPSADHALVALVLSRIQLSHREWNECARRLGRDGDGVGERWDVLLGQGRVGLKGEEAWT